MNLIFGSSGFAKEVESMISRLKIAGNSDFSVSYFVTADNDPSINTLIKDIPVISESEFYQKFSTVKVNCFIAVGNPQLKEKIIERLKKDAIPNFPVLIDPSACYDKRINAVSFQEGSIICGHSILTTDINVGAFTHINIDCTVGHDASIGDYATLSPGAHISGNVKIGKSVFIGTGAVILENIKIAEMTVIGAGAVVTSEISTAGTFVGMPAKRKPAL